MDFADVDNIQGTSHFQKVTSCVHARDLQVLSEGLSIRLTRRKLFTGVRGVPGTSNRVSLFPRAVIVVRRSPICSCTVQSSRLLLMERKVVKWRMH